MSSIKQKAILQIISMVILQLNLLLTNVNDSLDLQALFSNRFVQNQQVFSPMEAIKLVKKMFEYQCKVQSISLQLQPLDLNESFQRILPQRDLISEKDLETDWCRLPDKLKGDQVRFKQVLINLVRLSLKSMHSSGQLYVRARFDHIKKQIIVQIEEQRSQFCFTLKLHLLIFIHNQK